MRTFTKSQPTVRLHEVKTQGRRIHLRGEVELDLPLPAQDERLPAALAPSMTPAKASSACSSGRPSSRPTCSCCSAASAARPP